jgi:hypothetical protein
VTAEEVASNAGTIEPEASEAVDQAPPPIAAAAAAEDGTPDSSGDVLPLHKWLQSATELDESAAADWPHALLSDRRNPKSD